MPNQADPMIVEGIKQAMLRGASLKQAMMTFFNAGYAKEDIEAAARVIQQMGVQRAQPQKKPVPSRVKQPIPTKIKSQIKKQTKKVSAYGAPKKAAQAKPKVVEKKPGFFANLFKKKDKAQEKPKQLKPSEKKPKSKVSNYQQPKPKSNSIFTSKWFIISLVIVFIVLIGILIGLFLFKDQIVSMLNR